MGYQPQIDARDVGVRKLVLVGGPNNGWDWTFRHGTWPSGDFFPGIRQMLKRWDATYPLNIVADADACTNYNGGWGYYSYDYGIDYGINQGSVISTTRSAGVPSAVPTYLLCGNSADIPGPWRNEHTGPSDGTIFTASCSDTGGIGTVSGTSVLNAVNHARTALGLRPGRADQDMAQLGNKGEPTMPYFEVESGVRMHYQDRGSGRPIVFVHGWGGAGDAWDYQVLDLADRFRCITVDLRGHGDSDKPWGNYNYDLFCRDLKAFMTGIELEDVTLVGWSMGGHIGLKYVSTIGAPVARLVITGSGPRFYQAEDAPYGTPADQVQGLVDAVRFARAETIAGLYGNNFHRTDFEATRDWFIQTGWKVPAFVGVTSFEAIVAEDLRSVLPDISIPVGVFSGRHDLIWDPQWSELAAKAIPGAKLRYFDNSGHVAFIEDRVEWNHELEKFIDLNS